MPSGPIVATAWIKVLPSLDGLQAALVRQSRGAVLHTKVAPAKDTPSIFSAAASKLGPLFSSTFGASSAPSFSNSIKNILSSLTGNFSNAGKHSGELFAGGFSGFVGPQGISGYLKLGAATAGIAVIGRQVGSVASSILNLGNDWAGINARIQNAVGNTGDWHDALRQTESAASGIGVKLDNLVDQSARLVLLAPETIPDYSTALKFTTLLNKNMIATGASTEEAASASRQITQALGKGIVNGDELNSIMENAPEIARMLAKHLNVGVGQLKEMGKAGVITGNDLRDAVLENASKINDEFNKMPMTVERAVQAVINTVELNVSEAAVKASTVIGNSIKRIVTEGYLTDLTTGISNAIESITPHVAKVLDNFITQVGPHLSQAFADVNMKPFLDSINNVIDLFSELSFSDIINDLKIIGFIGGIAFSGILGGVDNMLLKIPFVGKTLVKVKNSLVNIGAAATTMGGEATSAIGGLIDKAGKAVSSLSGVVSGFAKSNKAVEDFGHSLEGMDFSELPKTFTNALDALMSKSGNAQDNVDRLGLAVSKLSETAKTKLPAGFGSAFAELQGNIAKTDTSLQGMSGKVVDVARTAVKMFKTLNDQSSGLKVHVGIEHKATDLELIKLRTNIADTVSKFTGITIPDFLAEPLGAMVATTVNFVNRIGSVISFVPSKIKGVLDAHFMKTTGMSFAEAFINGFQERIGPIVSVVESAVNKAVSVVSQFPGKAIASLKGFGNNAKESIYSALKIPPSIQNGIDSLSSKVGSVASSIKDRLSSAFGVASRSVKMFTDHFGGLKSFASSALQTIASKAINVTGKSISGLGKIVSGVGKAFSGIGRAASSLGITAAATSALTGALGKLYNSDPSEFGEKFNEITQDISNKMDNFAHKAPDLADAFAATLPNLVNVFTNALPGVVQAASHVVTSLANAVTQNMPMLMSAFSVSLQAVFDQIPVVLPALVGAFITLFTGLAQALPGMIGMLGNGLIALINALIPIISDQLPVFFAAIGDMFTQIGVMLPTLAQSIANALPALFEAISDALPQMVGSLTNGIVALIEGIVEILPTMIPVLVQGAITLVEGIVNSLPQLVEALLPLIPAIIQALSDTLADTIPVLIDGALKLMQALVAALPEIIQALIDALPATIQSIVDAITTNLPLLIDGAVQLVMGIVEALPEIIQALIDAAPDIIAKLAEALIDAFPKIIEAFGEGFVTLAANLPRLIGVVLGAIPGIVSSLAGAFGNLGSKILDHIGDIPGKIIGLFDGAGRWLINAGSRIMNGLLDGLRSAWKGVTDFVGGIGDWIREHKGPPAYDKILLVHNGELIMQGLNKGLLSGFVDTVNFVGAVNDELYGIGNIIRDPLYDSPSINSPDVRSAIGQGRSTGRNIYQNFPAKIIRNDEDLYTAYPQLQRIAINEAGMV